MTDKPPFGSFEGPTPFEGGGPFQPAEPFAAASGFEPGPVQPSAFDFAATHPQESPLGQAQPPAPPAPAGEPFRAPPPVPPGAPAPPTAEMQAPGGPQQTPLGEFLWRRLESLEHDLKAAQRQALESQSLLRQQEELRTQVETQLKLIAEQVRREKAEKATEEEKAKAHGRVDALEKRLDEMHQTWAQLLREAIGAREGSSEAQVQELRQLRMDLGALAQTVGAVQQSVPQIGPQIEQLKAQIPQGTARWEEDARRLETAVSARLTEIERRMADEMERQRDRVADLSRERAAVEQAISEQRHQLTKEFGKERLALIGQFNEQSSKLEELLQRVIGSRDGEGYHVQKLQDMISRVDKMLSEPQHAKDEVVRELDQERRDLMNAMKERAAQFHAFSLERREVERSLGETLLKLQRELDEARAEHVTLESRIAELRMQVQAADARVSVTQQESASKDERFSLLASERDALAKALMEEAEKVREHLTRVAEADRTWAQKVEAAFRETSEEKQKRIRVEAELADLRARVQSLSDHLARALQEKDQVAHRSTEWQHEKEQLLGTLKKKDEMIAMLSSTFKNLLKK